MKTVAKPKVFISYTWRSDDPSNPKDAEARGLKLADRLRVAGLDCRIDKYFLYSLHGFLKPQRRPSDKVEPMGELGRRTNSGCRLCPFGVHRSIRGDCLQLATMG
jgi:hypothetical protein